MIRHLIAILAWTAIVCGATVSCAHDPRTLPPLAIKAPTWAK